MTIQYVDKTKTYPALTVYNVDTDIEILMSLHEHQLHTDLNTLIIFL